MPSTRRRAPRYSGALMNEEWLALDSGIGDDDAFGFEAVARAAWEAHRDEQHDIPPPPAERP